MNTRVRASFAESEDTRDGEQGVIELLSYCQGKGVPRVEEGAQSWFCFVSAWMGDGEDERAHRIEPEDEAGDKWPAPA